MHVPLKAPLCTCDSHHFLPPLPTSLSIPPVQLMSRGIRRNSMLLSCPAHRVLWCVLHTGYYGVSCTQGIMVCPATVYWGTRYFHYRQHLPVLSSMLWSCASCSVVTCTAGPEGPNSFPCCITTAVLSSNKFSFRSPLGKDDNKAIKDKGWLVPPSWA